MQVKVTFDVELPEEFVIEKEQPFESALEKITYRKLPTSYEKSVKNGETEIITIEEAAKDYFLASTFSDEYYDSISCSVPREEIINRILQGEPFGEIPGNIQNEAFATAIQALEQELCEDAISKQAVLNLPRKALKNYFGEVIAEVIYVRDVMELPPVTPQPKTDILDKIRAEIEQYRKEASNKHSEDAELQAYYDGLNDGLKDARDIIDKYRVESEV